MRILIASLVLSFAPAAAAHAASGDLAQRIASDAVCAQAASALDLIQKNEDKNVGTVADIVHAAQGGLDRARKCKDPDGRTYLVGMLQSELGAATIVTDIPHGTVMMRGAAGLLAKCASHVEIFGRDLRRKCIFQKDRQDAILARLRHAGLTH